MLQGITADTEEAMMNIIAWYEAADWMVLIFPRAKHRPSFYFAEGDERLLISPAAVDLGGVSITPVEADSGRSPTTSCADVSGSADVEGGILGKRRKAVKS